MRLLRTIGDFTFEKLVAPNPDIVPCNSSVEIVIGILEEDIVKWYIQQGYETERFSINRSIDSIVLTWYIVKQSEHGIIKAVIYYDDSIKHTQAISVAYKKGGKRFDSDTIDFVIKVKTFLV